jgi:hypothetical protein
VIQPSWEFGGALLRRVLTFIVLSFSAMFVSQRAVLSGEFHAPGWSLQRVDATSIVIREMRPLDPTAEY